MKKLYLFFASVMVLLLVSSVSAALCKTSSGYYDDCNKVKSKNAPFNHEYQGPEGKSSASVYIENKKSHNTHNDYKKPVFKGSYGHYRYKMYESGDYSPPIYFGYGGSGLGYGGFGFNRLGMSGLGYGGFGYGNYYGLGSGGYGGYGWGYSNFGYSRSYYPVYYSMPGFSIWI